MKARLPLLDNGAVERTPRRASDVVVRVPAGRALIGVCDHNAPELALGFALRLVAALRERGRRTAVLLAASAGRTREGDAQRMRAAGAESVLVLAEDALPGAAQRALTDLPRECLAIALGAPLAAHLSMLLSVRVSLAPATALRNATDVDVELGPGMEGSATLIGDWIARCIPEVSA